MLQYYTGDSIQKKYRKTISHMSNRILPFTFLSFRAYYLAGSIWLVALKLLKPTSWDGSIKGHGYKYPLDIQKDVEPTMIADHFPRETLGFPY